MISNETVAGGVALGLTVEAIERVGAETFIYGTRAARKRRAWPPTPANCRRAK